MTMGRSYSNTAAETELATLLTISGLSMTVLLGTGHGAAPFTLILAPDGALEEIVLVTAKVGLDYTITRAWGGTTANEHAAGTVVRHGAVAEDFREAAIAYEHLFGTPVYNPMDPIAPPTNAPLIDPATIVTTVDDTWGGLL